MCLRRRLRSHRMPIQRFGAILISKGEFDRYLDLLRHAHLDANLEHVMCRNLISIDWRGYVYDCDFNQMLDLPLEHGEAVSDRGLRSVIVSGSTRNQRLLLTGIRCAGLRAESPPTS